MIPLSTWTPDQPQEPPLLTPPLSGKFDITLIDRDILKVFIKMSYQFTVIKSSKFWKVYRLIIINSICKQNNIGYMSMLGCRIIFFSCYFIYNYNLYTEVTKKVFVVTIEYNFSETICLLNRPYTLIIFKR